MVYYNVNDDLEFILTERTTISYGTHNHVSKYVAGIVLDGEIILTESGKQRACKKDMVFVIPTYCAHSLEIVNDDTRLLTMCIRDSFMRHFSEEEGLAQIQGYLDKLIATAVLKESQAVSMRNAFITMAECCKRQQSNPTDYVEKVCAIILDSVEENVKLEQLSGQVHVSKYYLVHQFKSRIGLTPHFFQIQNRIRRAQRMLREGVSAAEVAAEMKFCDQSHFIKNFKQIVGVTPKEYVNSVAKLEEIEL